MRGEDPVDPLLLGVILACSRRANQRKFVALPKLASTFRLADLAGLFLRCICRPALLACDASSLSHMSAEDFPMRRVQPQGKGVSSRLSEPLLPARGQSRISISPRGLVRAVGGGRRRTGVLGLWGFRPSTVLWDGGRAQ